MSESGTYCPFYPFLDPNRIFKKNPRTHGRNKRLFAMRVIPIFISYPNGFIFQKKNVIFEKITNNLHEYKHFYKIIQKLI